MGRPIDDQVPLDKFNIKDSTTTTTSDGKKKKIRMDPQTQKSLTIIHKHLTVNGSVKSGFMTTSSQLVNDKQTKKDRAAAGVRPLKEEIVMKEEVAVAKVENDEKKKTITPAPVSSFKASSSTMSKSALQLTQGTDEALERGTEYTASGKDESKRSSWISSYKKKKSLYLSAYSSSHPNKAVLKDSISPSSNLSSKKSGSSGKSSTKYLSSSRRSRDSNGSSGSSKSKMPAWLEALKTKQRSLRMKQMSSSSSSTHNGDDDDDGEIVIQLSPRKRPKIATLPPPTTPEVAPWAHVQLRSTPKREAFFAEDSNKPEQESSDNVGTHTTQDGSLPNLFSVGDIINLDSLPPNAFPSQEESAVFPLKGNKEAKSGGDHEKIVIVGKSAVVTASYILGMAKKYTVTWWCHRSDVRSLTLNVEATGANLALTNGRPLVPLKFDSSDVCLDFAQTFCRGPSQKSDDDEEEETEKSSQNQQETYSSVSLTQDEESLLDKYRQYSHSERMKLKLTCLSPRGLPEEVEVALSPVSNSPKPNAVDPAVVSRFQEMLKMGIPPNAVRDKMKSEGIDAATISAILCESPVSAASAEDKSAGLSVEEEIVASKYRKMLKMGIPPDAVRHKMTTDGVQSNIVDAVLNEDEPKESTGSKPPNALSEEEEAIATKYRKMLKMRVPHEAVRHKMTTEGVDVKITEAVLAPSPEADAVDQLSGEEEVIASKYRRMLKMAVPLEAVKHKMTQDSVDLKIVSSVVNEASSNTAEDESSATPMPTKNAKSEGPVLSDEEERIASKYRNMLKVCIPKDAVRHKMKQEGVSDNVVEAVLGKEKESSEPLPCKTAKTNNRKTIAFHWTTSNLAPELLQQSIFGKAEQKKRKLATINPEESDIKKLEELFQKRSNSAKVKDSQEDGKLGIEMAKLLDLTRANNIAISLKAFNDFTFRSLAETINDLDPECKIVGERVQFIPNLLPTPKEILAIKNYNGDDDKLITAELFFRQIVSIKRIEDKVKVMKTMRTLEEHVEEARAGFNTLQEVCGQVLNSEKLIQVLEMVLNIGNLMNEGTLNGGVEAFKFESLPKLSQTKSFDGKTTVLDYIVETFIEKGERQALFLTSEFPDIQVR